MYKLQVHGRNVKITTKMITVALLGFRKKKQLKRSQTDYKLFITLKWNRILIKRTFETWKYMLNSMLIHFLFFFEIKPFFIYPIKNRKNTYETRKWIYISLIHGTNAVAVLVVLTKKNDISWTELDVSPDIMVNEQV